MKLSAVNLSLVNVDKFVAVASLISLSDSSMLGYFYTQPWQRQGQVAK